MRCGDRRKFDVDRSKTKLSKNRQSTTSVHWRVGLKGLTSNNHVLLLPPLLETRICIVFSFLCVNKYYIKNFWHKKFSIHTGIIRSESLHRHRRKWRSYWHLHFIISAVGSPISKSTSWLCTIFSAYYDVGSAINIWASASHEHASIR
jgi:hypothetical protein